MTVLKELNTSEIMIITDNKIHVRKIDEALKAYRPGAEFEARVRMGKEDGYTRFYKVQKVEENWVFLTSRGFKEKLLNLLEYDEIEELPKVFYEPAIDFLKQTIPKLPFKPRKYQIQMVLDAINKQNILGISATGSGKSLTIALLLEYFRQNNIKTVLVVPNINLLNQFHSDIKDYNLLDLYKTVHKIGGEYNNKHLDSLITISTWQSLVKLLDNNSDIQAIMIDEAHLATGESLKNILSKNARYKIGFTGTLPDTPLDLMSLEESLGTWKKYINARDLINFGLATDVDIVAIYLDHHKSSAQMNYNDEIKYIKESPLRMDFLHRFLSKLKGNTFVLYQHNQHGLDIYERLTGVKLTKKKMNDFNMQKKLNVFYMSGDVNGRTREKIRKHIEHTDDAKIVANYVVASTGINVPKLKNVVFASPLKSFIKIVQSIGRAIRLHPSMDKVYVYDLVDDISGNSKIDNKLLQHFYARVEHYEYEGHPIYEREFDLHSLLPSTQKVDEW